jgi:hypothetical protein
LGALTHYGIDGIDVADKESMRELAMRGGEYSEAERTALRNAFFSKYGCPEVLDDPGIGRQMADLARLGAAGRAMAITFARAQVWFINANMRAGEFPRALRSAGLAVRLAAAGGRRS